MLAILCFLAIAKIFDYFPSSIQSKEAFKSFKYGPITILSFLAFYTLKCFCIYGEIWSNTLSFIVNYDQCSFSKENEDDSTLISALNLTYYFIIDDRVNDIISFFLFVKIWYFSSPNEKWTYHSLNNLILWHFNYYLKNQEWDLYMFAKAMIFWQAMETLRIEFNPTKPDLYQGLSKLELALKFAKVFTFYYLATMIALAYPFYSYKLFSYYSWDILGIIFEGIYYLFLCSLFYSLSCLLIRPTKFIISNSLTKRKNINEVIIFAVLVLWGVFKIISLVLLCNGIFLLLEYYYYIPPLFTFHQIICYIIVFGSFLSYPKMFRKHKYWTWLCALDILSVCFSLYFLECVWYLLNK